jgi:hypothetical protein
MTRSSRSGWKEGLLKSLAPDCDVEAMLGDLMEERASRNRAAPASSHGAWYCWQVLRSIPELVWASVTGRGWPATWGAAFLLYVAAATLQVASSIALSRVVQSENWLTAINLIFGAATLVVAGCVAAWLRPRAAPALAAMVAIVIVVLMATAADGASLWFKFALILGPPSVVAGAAWFTRRRRLSTLQRR